MWYNASRVIMVVNNYSLTFQWSFGVLCWEVFSLGQAPYAGLDNSDIPEYLTNGYRLKKPTLCSDQL